MGIFEVDAGCFSSLNDRAWRWISPIRCREEHLLDIQTCTKAITDAVLKSSLRYMKSHRYGDMG